MPGDRDYIEQGIKEASLHANDEAALEPQVTPEIVDEDARELWPKQLGGEYIPQNRDIVRRAVGRAGTQGAFAPTFSHDFITFRRYVPRTVGRIAVFTPQIYRR